MLFAIFCCIQFDYNPGFYWEDKDLYLILEKGNLIYKELNTDRYLMAPENFCDLNHKLSK